MKPSSGKRIVSTGRRKHSVARVFLHPGGSGKLTVNGLPMESYFPMETCQLQAKLPLKVADLESRFDIDATIRGGGTLAQSVALQHGIARALVAYSPDLRASLKPHKLLRRDDRMKERKKYGQKGARARFQYSKR